MVDIIVNILFQVISFQVAMLDVGSSKLLFLTDCISRSSSPVVSCIVKSFPDILSNSLEISKDKNSIEPVDELGFILTKDAHITVIDSTRGDVISALLTQPKKESTALSMYIVGKCFLTIFKCFLLYEHFFSFSRLVSMQRETVLSLKCLRGIYCIHLGILKPKVNLHLPMSVKVMIKKLTLMPIIMGDLMTL